jgi:hypothetical protein
VSLSRRVTVVEASLSPTQLVLRWLAEAHAFGDIEPYVASLLAHDHPVAPLDRLAREAVQGVRTAMRGKRPEIVNAAVRSALRELIDREALLGAALSAQVALLVTENAESRRADPTYAERFAACRGLLAFRLGELRAAGEARSIVEKRYLDGHAALFPAVAAAWGEQVRATEVIADAAVRLAAFAGVPAAVPPDPEALSRRTTELVADLVEPAKSDALEALGEGAPALDIAVRWLRPKLVPAPTPVPDAPTR